MNDTSVKKRLLAKIMADDWSERDALPTGDPIGDVDEHPDPSSKGRLAFAKSYMRDHLKYNEMMRNRVLSPEGKNFDHGPVEKSDIKIDIIAIGPKCNCGVAKTYRNHTLRMHSTWCELRKNED